MRTECQGVLTWVAEQMTAAQMTTRIYRCGQHAALYG
jgi:hypothetical protein